MKQENFVLQDDGSPKAVNLCMDCTHRMCNIGPDMFSKCRVSHKEPTGFDVDVMFCSESRILGPCGQDGKFWEQRKKPWWKFWE